jgi:transcriptional regulator with XRE-family HTH domain
MEPQRLPGDPVTTLFGRRLRGLREEAGLTQRQLADLMRAAGYKMHQTTVAKIEAGERAVPVDEAAQFADVLGIDLTQMINVGKGRLVTAQLKVRSLEFRAEDYARTLEETQVLMDHTMAQLEAARARLKELEDEG